jgi:HK97 gp10 family phage protein
MAKDIDITIDKALLNLDKTARKGVISGLKEAGDRVQREIKRTRLFIDRTGNLRVSIVRQPVDEKALLVIVVAGMEYGLYVNDGTRYITPRRFMEEGKNKVLPQLEAIFVKHLNRAIDRG